MSRITISVSNAAHTLIRGCSMNNDNGNIKRLRPEILALAHLMQDKLDKNKHKDGKGWERDEDGARKGWLCPMDFLIAKLMEEVSELAMAVHEGELSINVHYEAADVANLAMMIADNYRPLLALEGES
jgi:NTP pyrophosphatase (non-canonical NTP hydrolase)